MNAQHGFECLMMPFQCAQYTLPKMLTPVEREQ